MSIAFPVLSVYDPAADSEGTLDPMGLYQIADQLATRLVPGVRERMQRIRFLTVISVGAVVAEDIPMDPEKSDVPPFLVWEWLVVEALIRHAENSTVDDSSLWGVPGTLVARRAIDSPGYLDARGYLKSPRIFGFHGVYKRLAVQLGLVDAYMNPRPLARQLVKAWAADIGQEIWGSLRPVWAQAIRHSLAAEPCRTRPKWNHSSWTKLAEVFWPNRIGPAERQLLTEMLFGESGAHSSRLTNIWDLHHEFTQQGTDLNDVTEEILLEKLREDLPAARPLLDAITTYENFCRGLQDAFDVIRFEAGSHDVLDIGEMAKHDAFCTSVESLDQRCAAARQRLYEFDAGMAALFDHRFGRFFTPVTAADMAQEICEHHQGTQRGKSTAGKRSWFDRLGNNRIFLRHQYRIDKHETAPGTFVHAYRGKPVGRFYHDLRAH